MSKYIWSAICIGGAAGYASGLFAGAHFDWRDVPAASCGGAPRGRAVAHGALRAVVLAGWLFAAPAVVVQGLTGWALPARYSKWWAALSVCGFGAVVAIFYLMVFKPA